MPHESWLIISLPTSWHMSFGATQEQLESNEGLVDSWHAHTIKWRLYSVAYFNCWWRRYICMLIYWSWMSVSCFNRYADLDQSVQKLDQSTISRKGENTKRGETAWKKDGTVCDESNVYPRNYKYNWSVTPLLFLLHWVLELSSTYFSYKYLSFRPRVTR